MKVLPDNKNSLIERIQQIQKAIQLEIASAYINLKGKVNYFAEFMCKELINIHSIYKSNGEFEDIPNLISKYKIYETLDLPSRMEIIKQTKLLLQEISNDNKKQAKQFTNNLWEIEVKWVVGVGTYMAKILNKLNIFTVQDLIYYWPRKHLNFNNRVYIKDLKVGMEATIVGIVHKISSFQSQKNTNLGILTAQIKDSTGLVSIHKFIAGKSNKYLLENYKKQFPKGALVMVSGIAQFDKSTRYQLNNFSVEVLDENKEPDNSESLEVGRLVPIYNLTEGLNQNKLRKIIFSVFDKFSAQIIDTLPPELNLMDFKTAAFQMHFPDSEESLSQAKERIVFEEFFLMQLPLAKRKLENSKLGLDKGVRSLNLTENSNYQKLLKLLPFSLTNAQSKVLIDIQQDLKRGYPMNRLIQGDVGSGKTIVALLAMLMVLDRGQQSVLMAPTEILAEQHFMKFQELLSLLNIRVGLLIGSQRVGQRREIITGLANGQINIVVGTQALIQETVSFNNLGLAIIDEQHRFGVRQREYLKKKGEFIDCLFMTATPIPRTMALAIYGNLDLSEIDELPPGRKPIKTRLVKGSERKACHEFVKKQLNEGRQAYIVYPLIEESETLSAKAIKEEAEKLEKIYSDYKIGIVHGKLSQEEKDRVMTAFRQNQIQILVGTTVIEVGVDVPNANIIIIENSERFGLSQLHQLRGRVGRGEHQSYCLLFANINSAITEQRLKIMEQTQNGFIISQEDLKLRGPGEFLGTKQSGISDFGLESLAIYPQILEESREKAIQFVNKNPELENIPPNLEHRLKALRDKADLLESG